MRKDIHEDFPLRGFVCCDGCGKPMKSCWTQGKYKKYPYYLCQTKGCDFYGKSVGRTHIEDGFEGLLKRAKPTGELVRTMERMLFDEWLGMANNHQAYRVSLEQELRQIDNKVEVFIDRIGMADSAALITGYERQVTQLEQRRVEIREKISRCGTVDVDYENMARTLFEVMSNPHEQWVSSSLMDKRMLLKMLFAEQLRYHRNEGYRTAALALPFSLLRDFSDSESDLVPRKGLEPSLPEEN